MLMAEVLNEMSPRLIPDSKFNANLNLDDKDQNENLAKKPIYSPDIIKDVVSDVKLIHDKNKKEFKLIDKRDGNSKILYFLKYKKTTEKLLNNIPVITQIRVWRKSDSPLSVGIAQDIFFNYLLPMTGVAMTDSLQTKDGQRFWGYVVKYSFDKNLFVYYVDYNTNKIKLLKNMNHFDDISKIVWGDNEEHENKKIVISNTKF